MDELQSTICSPARYDTCMHLHMSRVIAPDEISLCLSRAWGNYSLRIVVWS